MKKLLSFFCICLSIFLVCSYFNVSYADCEYTWWSLGSELDNCLRGSDLVDPGNGLVEWSIKDKIVFWTGQLASLLWLLAVGSIVYGALLMTISWWDDEKIKKWKDVVKWSMLWFLALLVSGWLVRIVIEVIFSVAW